MMQTNAADQIRFVSGRARILEAIAREEPVDSIVTAVCAFAEGLIQDSVVGVTFVDRARAFERMIAPSLPETYAAGILGLPVGPPHVGSCARAFSRGEPVTCADIAHDDRFSGAWRDLNLAHGIAALQSTPIVAGSGVPLGGFVVAFRRPRRADAWDPEISAVCTGLLAIGLERWRAALAREFVARSAGTTGGIVAESVCLTLRAALHANIQREAIISRVKGKVQLLLAGQALAEGETPVALRDVMKLILDPVEECFSISASGPEVRLQPDVAAILGVALREMLANALAAAGRVRAKGVIGVRWGIEKARDGEDTLVMTWRDHFLSDRNQLAPVARAHVIEKACYLLGAMFKRAAAPAGVSYLIKIPRGTPATASWFPEEARGERGEGEVEQATVTGLWHGRNDRRTGAATAWVREILNAEGDRIPAMDGGQHDAIAAHGHAPVGSVSLAGLTLRERDVLRCVLAGLSNRQIAEKLDISRRTVESHRASIMKRTGLSSFAELMRLLMTADAGRRDRLPAAEP